MPRKFGFIALALILLSALVYFFIRPVSVTTVKVTRGSAALFVYASGQVIPEEKIVLRSKTVARIGRFFVEEGQPVVKGELLVTLEGEESAAQLSASRSELAQAQTDYDYRKREYERINRLYQQQAVSLRDHDNALTALHSAENSLRRSAANVEAFAARAADYELVSPFNGFVLEKLLDTGAMVTNNDGILALATKESMIVEGKVDELDASKVRLGQKVLMSFDGLPGKVYEGVVQTLAPRIDYATKSFKIKITVAPDLPVRAGMSAELNILVEEKQQALMIPVKALGDGFVWIEQAGKAKKKSVKPGLRDSRSVEILEGLQEGDSIIENPSGLSENMRVNARSTL